MNAPGPHQLLGAYLLGGLESEEARAFEQHLSACEECRRELEDLASLPALLDAVPVPDAVALTIRRPTAAPSGVERADAVDGKDSPAKPATPDHTHQDTAAPEHNTPEHTARERTATEHTAPDHNGPEHTALEHTREDPALGILHELAARRRKNRRRWAALGGAAAAACLALGVLAGPLLNPPLKPDASYSVQSGNGLQLTVGLLKKTWGTELEVEGRGLPVQGTMSMWVKGRDGAEDRACAWTATPSGRIKVTGATPVQLTGIAGVELRDEAQKTVAVISVPGS